MALGVFAVQESSCPGYRSLDPVEDLKKAILRILLSTVKTDGGNSERPKALDLARDLEPNIDMELRRAAEELTDKDWLIDIQNLEIGEKLASGSSGDLHQGTHLWRDVAIKILNLEDDDILNFNNFSTKELLQMFMQEVSILRLLPSHKNILQFIGAGLCWPRLYIITELMLGDVLQTRESAASCRRPSSVLDPFDSTRWSLKILRDAARGVNFLHRNGIMHRDLKAANLLLDKQGVVKVCDLGLAKPFKAIKPAAAMQANEKPTEISVESSFAHKGPFKGAIKITGILRAKLRKLRGEEDTVNVETRGPSGVRTKGGKRLGPGVSAKVVPIAQPSSEASNMTGEIGTLKWMSPEVLLHVPYDHKADVYSFGILIWEICTGEVPYAGLTPLQAASEVVNHGLRPIMPPSVPPELAQLAQQCWRHNPQERPEFTEIEAILEELSTSLEAQSWASLHTKSGFGRKPKWLCSMDG